MAAPLVVQKFGGSSLAGADRIKRVARRIARERAAGNDLVVAVSAMGDTTDELMGLASAITEEPDLRELDMLLATGEHQSATLVSMALHALGVAAISLTGPQAGITTDGRYGKARIANIEPRRVQQELEHGKVVIVAGFQGLSAQAIGDDEITTLGRGGTDTTAVALAARLGANRCQIFTDVRGIYTADPRLVPSARQLSVIGYEEMLELAHQGAQVMQTRAVELGWVNDVVIEVLSSFEDAPGTLITEDPLVEQRNKVRGLAHDRNVAKVTLVEVPDQPGVAAHVFEPLAEAGINVDMIVQNVGHARRHRPVVHDPAGRARPRQAHARTDHPRPRLPRDHHRHRGRQGVHRRRRDPERSGLCRADVPDAGRCRGQHRDDLHLGDPHHDASSPRTRSRPPLRALHDAFELERPETIDEPRRGRLTA